MKALLTILSLTILLANNTYSQTDKSSSVGDIIDQGVKLNDEGDYKGAIDLYKKALAKDPKSARATYEIANTYFEMQDYTHAIEWADKIIAAKDKYVGDAYMIKGSALDVKGEPKEAVKTYEKGIRENPKSYLLHYNLALTYYELKKNKEAEEELISALKINPSHPSSHLLLAYINNAEGKRIQSVLALYNFLVLEPNTKRSETALTLLKAQMKKGVTRNGNNTTISVSPNDKDEFMTAELMLSLLEASKNLEGNKDKTDAQLFYENTNSLFTTLGEIRKDNKGFWWDFYVDYFSEMAKSGNTEAMCYYITQSADKAEVNNWIKNNDDKIKAFTKWKDNYR